VDPRADDDTALPHVSERERDELAGRSEEDRCVELLGRPLVRVACRRGAERASECLRLAVARPRQCVDRAPLVHGDLTDDVRCRSEPVEPDPLRVAGAAKGAVADQAGAEERGGLHVGRGGWQREAVALVGEAQLRVPTVQLVAGEARRVAEVLVPGQAEAAGAARPAEPRHADAVARREASRARDDLGDDLVPEDERELGLRELPVRDVQVGPADAAGKDAKQGLPLGRHRVRHDRLVEWHARPAQQHRAHDTSMPHPLSDRPRQTFRARRAGEPYELRRRARGAGAGRASYPVRR
jgi:hypothetical protein